MTLYGLTIVPGRTVTYSSIDPELCREMFIRHALVEREWDAPHAFLRANDASLAALAEQEERSRRRDVVVDDDQLVELYSARIPGHVVSAHLLHAGDDNHGIEEDSTVYRHQYGSSYAWVGWEAAFTPARVMRASVVLRA